MDRYDEGIKILDELFNELRLLAARLQPARGPHPEWVKNYFSYMSGLTVIAGLRHTIRYQQARVSKLLGRKAPAPAKLADKISTINSGYADCAAQVGVLLTAAKAIGLSKADLADHHRHLTQLEQIRLDIREYHQSLEAPTPVRGASFQRLVGGYETTTTERLVTVGGADYVGGDLAAAYVRGHRMELDLLKRAPLSPELIEYRFIKLFGLSPAQAAELTPDQHAERLFRQSGVGAVLLAALSAIGPQLPTFTAPTTVISSLITVSDVLNTIEKMVPPLTALNFSELKAHITALTAPEIAEVIRSTLAQAGIILGQAWLQGPTASTGVGTEQLVRTLRKLVARPLPKLPDVPKPPADPAAQLRWAVRVERSLLPYAEAVETRMDALAIGLDKLCMLRAAQDAVSLISVAAHCALLAKRVGSTQGAALTAVGKALLAGAGHSGEILPTVKRLCAQV